MALPPVKPNCPTNKVPGKRVAIDVCWDVCGNIADPTILVFKPLGGMQTKGLARSQETEDVTDDRTVGDYGESIGTRKTMSISGSGFMNYTDSAYSNLVALDFLFAQEGDLRLHVRLTEPHATTYAYMIVSNYGRDFPTDTPVTFELEMQTTGSDYGVMVVPTVPFVVPTGVTVTPATLALSVGDNSTLAAVVAPVGAQQAVTYTASAPLIASVSPIGIVTANGVGKSIITATVPGYPALTGICTVTVS